MENMIGITVQMANATDRLRVTTYETTSVPRL